MDFPGLLTKTASEAGGLAARWFATQLLGVCPECVANGSSRGGTLAHYWGNLDATIDNRALEHRRRTLPPRFFQCFRHETQYATSRPPTQDPITDPKSQKWLFGEPSRKHLHPRFRGTLSAHILKGRFYISLSEA
jgi:hypothetical protein